MRNKLNKYKIQRNKWVSLRRKCIKLYFQDVTEKDFVKNKLFWIVAKSKRIRNCGLPTDTIHFQIERVKIRWKNTNKTFNATSELESFIRNGESISEHGREKQVGRKVSRNRKRKSEWPRFFSAQWKGLKK